MSTWRIKLNEKDIQKKNSAIHEIKGNENGFLTHVVEG